MLRSIRYDSKELKEGFQEIGGVLGMKRVAKVGVNIGRYGHIYQDGSAGKNVGAQ